MTPIIRRAVLPAVLLTAVGYASIGHAEDAALPSVRIAPVKPKAAKAATTTSASKERRPGELEGWDSGVKAPVNPKNKRPPDALGDGKAVPDGGLPLPRERLSNGEPGRAPVGINENGAVGGMFKF